MLVAILVFLPVWMLVVPLLSLSMSRIETFFRRGTIAHPFIIRVFILSSESFFGSNYFIESVLDVRACDLLSITFTLCTLWISLELSLFECFWLDHLLFSLEGIVSHGTWSGLHLELELSTQCFVSDLVSGVKILVVRDIDNITSIILVGKCVLVGKNQVFLSLLTLGHLRLYLRFQGFKGFWEIPYSLCDGPANELEGKLLLS